jgi:hypothetical protein
MRKMSKMGNEIMNSVTPVMNSVTPVMNSVTYMKCIH